MECRIRRMFRTEGGGEIGKIGEGRGRVDSAQLIIGLGGVRATESIRLPRVTRGGGKKSGHIRGRIKRVGRLLVVELDKFVGPSGRGDSSCWNRRKIRGEKSNCGVTYLEFLGRIRSGKEEEEEEGGGGRGFKLNYRGRKRGLRGGGEEGGEVVGSVARASRQRDKRGQKRAKQMSVNNRLRPAARRSTPRFASTSVSVPLFH